MTRKEDESLTRALQPWIRRTAMAAATLAAYAAVKHRSTINRQVRSAVSGLQVFGDAAITRTLQSSHLKILETPNPLEAEDAFQNFSAKGAQRFEVNPAQLQFMIDTETITIVNGYVIRSRIPGVTAVMTNEVAISNSVTNTEQREYFAVRFTGRRFRNP